MLAIGVIELVALLVGFSPSASIESALPDIHVPDLHVPELHAPDLHVPDAHGPELHAGELSHVEAGPLSLILGWFSVGRVPILVLFVIGLASFAIAGYVIQWTATGLLGFALSAGIASIPAVIAAGYSMRWLGRWLGRIFPKDHTEAASRQDLIGSYATIIRGTAKQGQPAEAKTTDLRNRTHYILLEPDEAGQTYTAGDRVFIVGQDRNVYRAVTKLERARED
jgi:membrane protein implicated in regulation of membrane protease activity